MNRKELLDQATYHKNMAKYHQKVIDHHLEQADKYLKRAEKLQKTLALENAKRTTDNILENLQRVETGIEQEGIIQAERKSPGSSGS